MSEAYQKLVSLLRDIHDISAASAVLEWDQQTFMPPKGNDARSRQMATLAAIGLWRERNPLWWVSGLSALGVVVTVHTTKQHYWVDALAGVMLAWLMHRLVFDVIPAWRGKPVMYPLRGQPAPEPRIPSQV